MMERSRSKSDIFGILQKDIRALQADISKLFNSNRAVDWIAPAFVGAWVNFGSGETTLAYSRTSSGLVILRGLVKSGAVGTIFVLPVGFRPGALGRFAVIGGGALGYIAVFPTGEVTLQSGSNAYVDLSPVIFRAEQ